MAKRVYCAACKDENGYTEYSLVDDEKKATHVLVTAEELHLLDSALEVYQRKAIQEKVRISKAKPDKHGYTLLRADLKEKEKGKPKLWFITKSTPYSSNHDLMKVKALISRDLEAYYHLDTGVIWYGANFRYNSVDELEYRLDNSDGHTPQELVNLIRENYEKFSGEWIVEIVRYSVNHGAGLYEVSYWATAPI